MNTALALSLGLGVKLWAGVPAADVPIASLSAILIDAETGIVLYEKEPDVKRPIASTTKIVTALVLIEKTLPNETAVAPKDIRKVRQSSMHLRPGEKVPMMDLIHAIMLRSANDGTVAGATHVAGSVPAFVKLMNARAKQAGAKHTNFTNPHGLPDPKHVSTARDLALIAQDAMRNPVFEEVVAKQKYWVRRDINLKDQLMENRNKLLAADPSVDGIKTGWTIAAGHCFVGSATRNGQRLISVVLNSEDWQGDTMNLLNWGYANHTPAEVKPQGWVAGQAEVEEGVAPVVAVTANAIPGLSNLRFYEKVEWSPELKAPIMAGQKVGTLILDDGRGWRKTVDLVAQAEVPKKTFATAGYIAIGLAFAGVYAFLRYRRKQFYAQLTSPEPRWPGSLA